MTLVFKEPTCQCRRHKRCGFDLSVRKISWRRVWQPTPVFLLENPMNRGAWWATVHMVAKSKLQRHDWSFLTRTHTVPYHVNPLFCIGALFLTLVFTGLEYSSRLTNWPVPYFVLKPLTIILPEWSFWPSLFTNKLLVYYCLLPSDITLFQTLHLVM